MREAHGFEHSQKELQPIRKPQPLRFAPVHQRLALDVLHGQVRAPTGIDSRVVKTRDLGVLETCQDVALPRKALRQILPQLLEQRKLESHLALESAVCT